MRIAAMSTKMNDVFASHRNWGCKMDTLQYSQVHKMILHLWQTIHINKKAKHPSFFGSALYSVRSEEGLMYSMFFKPDQTISGIVTENNSCR